MFKTWTQPAVGPFVPKLALAIGLVSVGLGTVGLNSSQALELSPPNASAFEEAPVLVRRLPAVVNQPPAAIEGLEKFESGSGELIERLPAAINNLPLPIDPHPIDPQDDKKTPGVRKPSGGWSPSDIRDNDIGVLPPRAEERTKFREPELHLLNEEPVTTFEGDMSYGSVPPPFSAPLHSPAPPEPVDEFLPQTYHPPIDPHAGSMPRAYVPPPIVKSPKAQWAPWWDEPLGRVSLLSSPTVPVNLQELMNLSLRNSPVAQIARSAMHCGDCGKSKSRIDSMLYSVAQSYWETYRLRGVVIVRERLYQDSLGVCRQLRTLVGKDNELSVLAISSARERLAELAAAHEALRKAQNKLVSIVSIPNWEQEHELLPMDSPFCRPYRIDEAAELRNALSRRAEMQGMISSIQPRRIILNRAIHNLAVLWRRLPFKSIRSQVPSLR